MTHDYVYYIILVSPEKGIPSVMVKQPNPSGSRLNLLPRGIEKVATLGAIGAFAISGCTTSADALPESEALQPETTQSDIATQPTDTVEAIAEIYEGEPTRDSWNLDNLSKLTTEWGSLDEEQRRTEVQTFLQANIPGLNMNYFERTPEGMQQMAKNMWDIHSLIMELSVSPQIENVEAALENIITTMSANDEIKTKLLDDVLSNLEVERESIGKPYERGHREFTKSLYTIDGILRTSDDFFFTKDGRAIFATVAYNNSRDGMRYMYTLYIRESEGRSPEDSAGSMMFDSTFINTAEPVVHFGDDKISSGELYDSIPEKY